MDEGINGRVTMIMTTANLNHCLVLYMYLFSLVSQEMESLSVVERRKKLDTAASDLRITSEQLQITDARLQGLLRPFQARLF